MKVVLPSLAGPEAEAWTVIFELMEAFGEAVSLVGAQMVILHAAVHGVNRPIRTRDLDILVNVQVLRPAEVAAWLEEREFELVSMDSDGIGHKYRRGEIEIDILATDRAGSRADRSTSPPARTVEVPGGRGAVKRTISAEVEVNDQVGVVRLPDWLGALTLKARAAVAFQGERSKHLSDLVLLLGLPVDILAFDAELSDRARNQIGKGWAYVDDATLRGVARSVDTRIVMASAQVLRLG